MVPSRDICVDILSDLISNFSSDVGRRCVELNIIDVFLSYLETTTEPIEGVSVRNSPLSILSLLVASKHTTYERMGRFVKARGFKRLMKLQVDGRVKAEDIDGILKIREQRIRSRHKLGRTDAVGIPSSVRRGLTVLNIPTLRLKRQLSDIHDDMIVQMCNIIGRLEVQNKRKNGDVLKILEDIGNLGSYMTVLKVMMGSCGGVQECALFTLEKICRANENARAEVLTKSMLLLKKSADENIPPLCRLIKCIAELPNASRVGELVDEGILNELIRLMKRGDHSSALAGAEVRELFLRHENRSVVAVALSRWFIRSLSSRRK